jgi:hypothetical protein
VSGFPGIAPNASEPRTTPSVAIVATRATFYSPEGPGFRLSAKAWKARRPPTDVDRKREAMWLREHSDYGGAIHENAARADPPTYRSSTLNWRQGDQISLNANRTLRVLGVRDDDADQPPALVVEDCPVRPLASPADVP